MARKKRVYFAPRAVQVETDPVLHCEILVFTLWCGHTETRLRALYPHWKEGEWFPVKRLVREECSQLATVA